MTDTFTMDRDLRPIIQGRVPLPNPEAITADPGATILHYHQMHSGDVILPQGKKWGVRYFLDYGQGGQLYGSGVVAWTEWKNGAYRATAMKFAICKHEPKAGPNANPMRGYHQSSCSKCGLDMSIDSGD